jgi:hypothetical protein
VDEVKVDVEQVGFAGRGVYEMAVPDLLREGLGGHLAFLTIWDSVLAIWTL